MPSPTLHRTDHQLRTAIADELEWTPEVRTDVIGIGVNRGTVVLSGEVATYLEKDAAVKAALRVRGVTAVADEITVEHRFGVRDDVDIARDAAHAIDVDAALLDTDVKVTVEDGRVTLTGTVPWNYQRAAAARSVSRIRGVKGVYSRLTLTPTLPFAAGEARQRISEALMRNAQTDAIEISISIGGTEVALSGTVRTAGERAAAERAAWSTPGVTHVHNQLAIAP
jgi:osmotically-inducible protein OsmY